MARLLATALAIAILLPAGAEAAKFRGSRSSHADAPSGRSVVVTPGLARGSKTGPASAVNPNRVPFPPASAVQPPVVQVTAAEEKGPWCRSGVVAGGFCILN